MAAPVPQTIAKEVRARFVQVLGSSTHFRDAKEFEVRSLFRDVDKLIGVEPLDGSLFKAELYGLCGDLDGALHWISNARKYGAGRRADRVSLIVHTNLGHISAGGEIFDAWAPKVEFNDLGNLFDIGLVTCSFESMLLAQEASRKMNLDLQADRVLAIAQKGATVMRTMAMTEKHVQAVLDVAGEVLRQHNLLWQKTEPQLRLVEDEDGAGMLYQLYVGVSPEEAVMLTDEVLHLMIDRELDRPGFAFTFLAGED